MSNLLPQDMQHEVWASTRARFIAVAAGVFLVSAGFSAVALLPSYLVLTVAVPEAQMRAASAPNPNAASIADISNAEALINGLAPILAATSSPDTRIAAIVAAKPKTVHLNHISYTVGKPSVLMIVGVADDRDAINTYRAALLGANVGAVNVPVSALVGSSDGQFTITVSGDF